MGLRLCWQDEVSKATKEQQLFLVGVLIKAHQLLQQDRGAGVWG